MKDVIYFDNNATTKTAPEVVETMMPFFSEFYGNPSSMHTFGGKVAKYIDTARQQVADLIGAHPQEIVFTSCGTESDNHAIIGAIRSQPEKKHLITTRVEHPAVLNTCQYLSKNGYELTEIPVDKQGRINLRDFEESITENTAIISVMYANNETGVIFPVEEMAEIAKQKGILFHTDAVQAVGKIPIDMSKNTIDLMSISGHKLHTPKGIGVLYIRRGTHIQPLLLGGHQEKGRRGGTENVAYIVGLGTGCEIAGKYINEENTKVKALRDKLEDALIKSCPDAILNGDKINRLPNTSNISFQYIEGESILLLLNRENIAASSGSACTSGSLEPSHVMRAMGVPYTAAHGSVRFSLSRYNTEEEVDYVIEKLPPIIKRLREISPFGRD